MAKGEKFVASYSTGKDSNLALFKAIQEGMEPIGLIITYNTDEDRAWFHGLSEDVLKRLSDSLKMPIHLIRTSGEDYEANFEKKLTEFRKKGAEVCVFGDIDIEAHLKWGKDRCARTGLRPYFPLWQMERKEAVTEFLDNGFTAHITTVDTDRMSPEYLGEKLTKVLMLDMEADGIDVCGENGEYHTLVTGGPLFKKPFSYTFGERTFDGRYAKLPVL